MAQKTVNAEDLLRDIYQAESARRWFEQKYGLLSETFYRLYQQGKLRDEDPAEIQEYLEWAGWCEIYKDRRRRYEQAIEQYLKTISAGHQAPSYPSARTLLRSTKFTSPH